MDFFLQGQILGQKPAVFFLQRILDLYEVTVQGRDGFFMPIKADGFPNRFTIEEGLPSKAVEAYGIFMASRRVGNRSTWLVGKPNTLGLKRAG